MLWPWYVLAGLYVLVLGALCLDWIRNRVAERRWKRGS